MTTPKALRPEVLRELEDAERQKAKFCIRTGVRPDDYDNMTLAQITIWSEVASKE